MATFYRQPREKRPPLQATFGTQRLNSQEPFPDDADWKDLLVGDSAALRKTLETIALVAPRRSTVLITGETGTGKEVVARALHAASPRAGRPMVVVNAAALPKDLLEAELFGHVKGAFTGAIQQRVGRFEQAHQSTLFLDEIGDLPLPMQTKLLRFLQERELQRVGSSETIQVDVRLIAATNVNLQQKVRIGEFREDLYYRLNVVPIVTTPLRERPDDIPALARHFVRRICDQEQILPRELTDDALELLCSLPWPGNVRQLENTIERAISLCGEREELTAGDFAPVGMDTITLGGGVPESFTRQLAGALHEPEAPEKLALPARGIDFERTMGQLEARILVEALRRTGGNKTAAAELLQLKRTTLSAKLRALGLGEPERAFAAGA